ncbi:hypothetical protein [Nocardia alni]|uniref:hypothetical protein n=1 Tax=Nocardia alni TaxID=2815723 RepID=UPI001C24381F|nr:hypothetical protein [Nocardia alni]
MTLWNDGGGKVTAARRPLDGPDHVARWMFGTMAKPLSAGLHLEPTLINGELGLLVLLGDYSIGALTYDILDGSIRYIRFQVNPDKLAGLRTDGEK